MSDPTPLIRFFGGLALSAVGGAVVGAKVIGGLAAGTSAVGLAVVGGIAVGAVGGLVAGWAVLAGLSELTSKYHSWEYERKLMKAEAKFQTKAPVADVAPLSRLKKLRGIFSTETKAPVDQQQTAPPVDAPKPPTND